MRVITVSLSTRRDIMRFGFKEENISIISEGVHIKPVADIDSIKKYERPTMFTIGRIVSMKRIPHIIKAFEIAKKRLPHLQLIIAGGNTSKYGKYITSLASRSKYARDIQVTGRISEEKKREIMERSHVLAVTSVKEGWGLVVTEAGRCGTPSVVYDIDGLRDSVRNGVSGLITQKNTPESFAHSIVELLQIVPSTKLKVESKLGQPSVAPTESTFNSQLATFNYSSSPSQYYSAIRKNAWEFSKEITFEKQYEDFKYIIGITPKKYPYSTLIF
jgi:glycosyltransferase involved in cell wall biosynthesis